MTTASNPPLDQSDNKNPGVTIRVFGTMAVYVGDQPISIGGPRQRRLLALLAVRAGVTVSVDWLAEHLWDDGGRPENAKATLWTYVSRLRAALPEDAQAWIETDATGYRLNAPAEFIEQRRFAQLRDIATHARSVEDPATAVEALDEALAMWRGDPFSELEDLDWSKADVEQLRIDRLEMMEERWEAVLALGRHTQITGELGAFTAQHALRDRATRQYALALHRSGRTTESLRIIEGHRQALAEQGGLDPSNDMLALEQQILQGDASLQIEKNGRPLRGYRLLEQIGSGAFSVVWRGLQPSVNRDVAIKQIRAELATQPEFIRRFEAEAQIVARIEHPHIVPMIDFWRDPESAYLVMRWLRGGTLEERLDDGPLSLEATMILIRQIGGALASAHNRGVVHRDVKTANILFDEQGHAFLSDFGIALEAATSGGPEAALSQGSPAYAAPEQIRREPLGPPADIFSLGVVIFECLTGSLPFRDSSSIRELIDRQLNTPYPRISEWRSDVPNSIVDAVARATSKDPAVRFDSVDAFVDACENGEERPATLRAASSALVENPYKGLRAFGSGDTADFFGRERLVAELVDRLAGNTIASRCLVVVGPSGSGKSSVVRAGLEPALRSGAVEGSDDWFTTVMVPGTDPFESLEAALLRIAVNPPPSLLSQLRDGDRGVLRGMRRCLENDDQRVLVVIDQFEEVFIGESSELANDFLNALAVAVEDPNSPLRLVLTLRADYYHRPLEHPVFAQILKNAAIDVTPLAGDELERVIVEPAARVGVSFESGLVPRIAADTAGQASPLPLLQYTLSELFERREDDQLSISAYDELGGLSGALSSRAERLYTEADDAQRSAVRRLFGRMTNPGEHTTDLRRRVTLADLGDDEATIWALDQFGASRLVTFDRDIASREPTVEVAHEALLREWPRLVTWLEEDNEILRSANALAMAATTWEEGGRQNTDLHRGDRLDSAVELRIAESDRLRELDIEFIASSQSAAEAEHQTEQRRVRRLQRLVSVVGVALVAALIAGAVALKQQDQAEQATKQAELAAEEAELATQQAESAADKAELAAEQAEQATEQAEQATLISRSAAQSAQDPELSLLLALEAHRRAPEAESEHAVLNALGSSTNANRVASLKPLRDPLTPCLWPGVWPRHGAISMDGLTETDVVDGRLLSQDLITGAVVDHGPTPSTPPSPTSCGLWVRDEDGDRAVVESEDGLSSWYGPEGGPWVETNFDEPTYVLAKAFRPTNRLVYLIPHDDGDQLLVRDDRTGEPVGTPVGGDAGYYKGSVDVTSDGSLVAAGFAFDNDPEGDGRTFIIDGQTGEEIFHINTPAPAQSLIFDEANNQLIAGMFDGSILTIDIAASEVVSKVVITRTSDLLDLGVRADGIIVAVTAGQVVLVDRSSGPTGTAVELRRPRLAWIRPDGTLLITTTDESLETIDLDSNSLIEQTWEADPFAHTAFNAGLVAALHNPGRVPVVVNLTTGERSTYELKTPTGEPFPAIKVYPEADGIWAFSRANVMARWEGEEMAEQLDLGGSHYNRTQFGDRIGVVSEQPDGTRVVDLVSVERGATGVVFRVPAPDGVDAHPSIDGGVHVIEVDGTLKTYDSAGVLTSETETGMEDMDFVTVDPTSGKVALISEPELVIVDPSTGTAREPVEIGSISNVGFGRDGELLVFTRHDGTVRLWDVEREEYVGLVWNGPGQGGSGSPLWYDESTESMWVVSSGKYLQIPLNPERWVERACEVISRDLTQDEWDRFVPGSEPLRSACA